MDVEFEIQFINARATALLAGGLGQQLDIQDKIVVKEQYKDGIIIPVSYTHLDVYKRQSTY